MSILLTACLLVGLLPAALAADNTGAAPSLWAYATKEQLTDDTFSPNYSGIPENIGKLTFGQRFGTTLEWYLLGKGKGSDDAIIFAATPLGTNIKFLNGSAEMNYKAAWGCSYPSSATIEKVYPNHYGGSNLRTYLNYAATTTYDYFTVAELSMMKDAILSIQDTRNGISYNITDKLYTLSSYESGVLMAGGLGEAKFLAREYYWNHGDSFWLCTPYEPFTGDGVFMPEARSLCVVPEAVIGNGNGYVQSRSVILEADVRPTVKLDLSSVLFASAAGTASSGTAVFGTIGMDSYGEPKAMTLRLDGSSKNIGSVTYNTTKGNIRATKGSTTGNVALVVQGNDGTTDWYYSKQITGTETVNVSAIKSALGLSNIDLSKCKIWLETTEDNLTYAVTVTGCGTEAELRSAIEAGISPLTLTNDITLSSKLQFSDKIITLDLAGRTITGDITLSDNSAAPDTILTLIDSDPATGGVLKGDITLTQGSGSASHLYANGGTVTGMVSLPSYAGGIYCTSDTPTAFKGYAGNYGEIHGGIFYGNVKESCIKEKTVTFMNGSSRYALEVVADGSKVIEPASHPTKAGYNFVGWYNGNTKYTFGSTLSASITLTANFGNPINYNISYNLDGGTAVNPTTYTVESGAFTLVNPTKTGHTFTGWSGTGLSGNNNKTVTIAKGSTGNRSYTAHWTVDTYTVKLNTNGGTINSGNVTGYTYGKGAVLPTDVTKTGHTFAGWYDNAACTGKPVTVISTTTTGAKEYWAKWEANQYTITVESAENGSVTADRSTAAMGDTVTLTVVPEKCYTLKTLTVTGENGAVTVKDLGNGKCSFTMPASGVSVRAVFAEGTHTLTKTEAKTPTCTEAGNSEYWTCSVCGKYFSDENGKNEIAKDSWVMEATGHSLTKTEAKTPTCTEAGNSEYWTCSVCGKYFSDENGKNEIAKNSWVMEATGHSLTKTEAKTPTCTEAGNSEYWTCSVCGKYFSDKDGKNEIAKNSWVLEATGHSLTKTEAKTPTCTEAGNSEYWTCSVCGKYFSDKDGKNEIAKNSWVMEATGHSLTKTEAKTPTCTEAGNSEYWTCSVCGKYFSDENGKNEIAKDSWVMEATGHSLTKTEAKTPTCTEAGNSEYWTCSVCGKYFSDKDGKNEIAKDSWVMEATGHSLTKTEAKTPTCTEAGNSEYWTCSVCGKYFSDKDGKAEIAKDSWVMEATGHSLTKTEANTPTCTEAGNSEYWTCSVCGKYFSDKDGKNEIAKDSWVMEATGHSLTKTEAKTPTCTEAGNSEYWTCSVCGKYFSDKDGKNEIAKDSWVTPATGHTPGEWECDSAEHWRCCTVCGIELERGKHTFSGNACTICGFCKDCDGGENCPSGKFVDVNTKAWYHPYVDYAVTHGLFGGTSANTFEPETAMTRAMLVTVLWRYEGKPMGYENTFTDVNAKSGSWYIDAVAWAAANGVVNGTGNGKFEPEGKITREQMATILLRYAQKKGIDTSKRGDLSAFSDADKTSGYAMDAMQWAVAEGLINGSDGKLLPQDSATRAQVAAILMRFIENIVKK